MGWRALRNEPCLDGGLLRQDHHPFYFFYFFYFFTMNMYHKPKPKELDRLERWILAFLDEQASRASSFMAFRRWLSGRQRCRTWPSISWHDGKASFAGSVELDRSKNYVVINVEVLEEHVVFLPSFAVHSLEELWKRRKKS